MENRIFVYKIKVDGMRCGMCEAHINNVIRNNFNVKKVKSSARKKLTIIKSIEEIDLEKFKHVISESGYTVGDIEIE